MVHPAKAEGYNISPAMYETSARAQIEQLVHDKQLCRGCLPEYVLI